ncbi:phosphatase PAP2 family protein [Kitasatospora sp. NPDC004289]
MYPSISGARAGAVPPAAGRPGDGAGLRRRRQLLVCTAVSLGSAALLATLALLVLGDWRPLRRLDEGWIASLHGYALDHTVWTASMQTLADIGSTVTMRVLLALTALWLWAIGARTLAGWATTLILTGWLVESGGKELAGRDRPLFHDPVAAASGLSFPSGHALTSTVTCGALVILVWPRANRSGRIAACGIAGTAVLAIGWTRIALGLHWPSDVLGGWLAGALVISAVTLALELWRPGALSRDVHRVGRRTRPRVQRVLATPEPSVASEPADDLAHDPAPDLDPGDPAPRHRS